MSKIYLIFASDGECQKFLGASKNKDKAFEMKEKFKQYQIKELGGLDLPGAVEDYVDYYEVQSYILGTEYNVLTEEEEEDV